MPTLARSETDSQRGRGPIAWSCPAKGSVVSSQPCRAESHPSAEALSSAISQAPRPVPSPCSLAASVVDQFPSTDAAARRLLSDLPAPAPHGGWREKQGLPRPALARGLGGSSPPGSPASLLIRGGCRGAMPRSRTSVRHSCPRPTRRWPVARLLGSHECDHSRSRFSPTDPPAWTWTGSARLLRHSRR